MTEYRAIIDNIVAFVSSSQIVGAKGVPEWAEAYTELCRQTNERLRLCADALKRGLRSDAIQIADEEPNVLDLVSALDFPEAIEWRGLCALEGLSQPPRLLLELAAALNEAYATEQPTLCMLAHHRLMAVARAPLRDRLAMMRRIAEVDSSNSFWDDDIRVFERKLVEEMRAELNHAIRGSDNIAVARLLAEATGAGWRAEVPADFVALLQTASRRLTAVKAVAELRQLLPKLNDAYGAMAHQECKTLLAQWTAIAAPIDSRLPADLEEALSPIVGWVKEQDQRQEQQAAFGRACDVLQQVLDTDQPTPALERAYQATLAFHLDLPEDLESRYQQRSAARALATRHRRRLIYAGIAATFIIAVGIVSLLTYEHMLASEIAGAQQVLADATTDAAQGELDKSTAVRTQLVEQHPRILHDPLIIKALADVDSALDSERKRRADFKQHMLAATNAGIEHPDDAELSAAQSLAKLPEEIAQVTQLKGRIAQVRAQTQQERDQQFADDGTKISNELEHNLTAQLLASNVDEYAKQLDLLKKEVIDLTTRAGVSDDLKQAQSASLNAVLGRRQKDLDGAKGALDALARVRHFGSTAEQHAAALRQFIDACPNDPRCADFKTAMENVATEKVVEAWSDIVGGWSTPLPESLQSAKDRVTQIQEYLAHNADSPLATAASAYLDYVNKKMGTVAPDGPWKSKFHDFLSLPLLNELKCLVAGNGDVYYVRGDITVTQAKLENVVRHDIFDAVMSPDLSHPTQITLDDTNLLTSMTPSPTPQSAFVATATDKLKTLDFRNGESFGIDMVQDLMACKDINPVLRSIILQHILQLNQPTATWGGQADFDKVVDALVEENVEDISWLDPRHPPDPKLVNRLNDIVGEMPPLKDVRVAIQQRRDLVAKAVQFGIAGEGVLLGAGDSREIVSSLQAAATQSAWAIGPDRKLVQVARRTNEQWTIDRNTAQSLPEGSLVFIVMPSN
jgi:hypothetical protein